MNIFTDHRRPTTKGASGAGRGRLTISGRAKCCGRLAAAAVFWLTGRLADWPRSACLRPGRHSLAGGSSSRKPPTNKVGLIYYRPPSVALVVASVAALGEAGEAGASSIVTGPASSRPEVSSRRGLGASAAGQRKSGARAPTICLADLIVFWAPKFPN